MTDHSGLIQAAFTQFRQGNYPGAERLCREVLAQDDTNQPVLTLMGMICGTSGQHRQASEYFGRLASLDPNSPEAHFNHAKALKDSGELDMALAAYDRSLALAPNQANAHNNRGNVLLALGKADAAREAFSRALELNASDATSLGNLGQALFALGDFQGARDCCEASLRADPRQAPVLATLGSALMSLKLAEAATQAFASAISIDSSRAEFHHNHAVALGAAGREGDAKRAFETALELNPGLLQARIDLGHLLQREGSHEEALAQFRLVLSGQPSNRTAGLAAAGLAASLSWHDEALKLAELVLQHHPDDVDGLKLNGVCLMSLGRYPEAKDIASHLCKLIPDEAYATWFLIHMKSMCCEWSGLEALIQSGVEQLAHSPEAIEPFFPLSVLDSPSDLLNHARQHSAQRFPARPLQTPKRRAQTGRIHIGYVSGEFRDHATSALIVDLLELHDKDQFRITAFDNGWNDGSELRARVTSAVDDLVTIRGIATHKAVSDIQRAEVDILVDLNGYAGLGRQDIFAARAAPVQVNYLGFPGSLGADYMDYIVADPIVIPQGSDDLYTEKVIRLPHCYQCNDRKRAIADQGFTRKQFGLPESGFVFCSLNNSYKILPSIFDIWMRLLSRVPGSVLWIYQSNSAVIPNLQREAAHRGVEANRIVSAPDMKRSEHLARLRLADLFLDTAPYNAHTTAGDALWAGLPLVTCMGRTFPSRVAGSLLKAVGLPELVTENRSDYESLALKLALDKGMLDALQQKLLRNKLASPLFNTPLFAKHLEIAYKSIVGRSRQGLPAVAIDVRHETFHT